MFSEYGKLSTQFYEATKPIGFSMSGDIEFYQQRLAGTTGRILEAGVGTGRMLIPLLENGLCVDGVDASNDMLALCREHCEKRNLHPFLMTQRLEELELPHTYEAIIMPTGSFALLNGRKNAMQTLMRFNRHLSPGGRILIDLGFPKVFSEDSQSLRTVELSDKEGITLSVYEVELNWIDQYSLTYLTYRKWRSGKEVDTELQQFKVHWYGVKEFTYMLKEAGFTSIQMSADYLHDKAPSKETSLITFEAIRR
ncbi:MULTISPECIES: class I SAM-dependent methyltransferase [Bacillaceae]|uniref:Methyltransferase n=1 Tax=Alkalicoccobacillus plakortidis TaxID=444060 RepID=A0A9D5I035_9BACI|nr:MULTISPECIES: class I SAM-dependent methyltransferase [Bacillaceae]KQL56574.1 methyltransferase [Alkalicoccobacillus plakortidis]